MSIWAKLSGNAAFQQQKSSVMVDQPQTTPNSQFYYSSSSGQMISSDGSGYVIPDLFDVVVEKHDFIPKELATDKLKSVLKDSQNLRNQYEQNIEKLTQHYTHLLQDSKQYYENLIQDLKQKAVRHVDIQKQMKQQVEDRLSKELKQSEDTLEELRDSMATLNRQYQDETRKLKIKNNELERLVSHLKIQEEEKEISNESKWTLFSLVNSIEQQHTHDFYKETISGLHHEMETLINNYDETLSNHQRNQEEEKNQIILNDQIRHECKEVIDWVLHTLEIQTFSQDLIAITTLQAEISSLQASVEKYEAELSEKSATIIELTTIREALEATIAEKNQEIELLINNHESQKANLLSSSEQESSGLKEKFNLVLKQMKLKNDSMEVKLCLSDMMSTILGRHIEEITEMTHNQQEQLYELASKHEKALQAVPASPRFRQEDLDEHKRSLEVTHLRQKENFLVKMQRLQEGHDRLEVEITMLSMINSVYDRVKWQPHTPPEPVTIVSPILLNATSDVSSEEKLLLQKELLDLRQQLNDAQSQLDSKKEELEAVTASVGVTPVAATNATPLSKEEEEISNLRKLIVDKKSDLQQIEENVNIVLKSVESAREERDDYKNQIKEWTKSFQEENGRDPEVGDKAVIRDKYQNYKVSAMKAKELESKLSAAETTREEVVAKLEELEAQLQALFSPSSENTSSINPEVQVVYKPSPKVPMQDAEVQVLPHDLRSSIFRKQQSELVSAEENKAEAAPKVEEKKEMADITKEEFEEMQRQQTEALEQLEDQLYAMKEEAANLRTENTKIEEERQLLTNQLDALIKEKRTDVIKRYEEDLASLKKKEEDLDEKVAHLSTEKQKLESRVNELRERAERAEQELRERDQREQQKMNPQEESFQLKGQINKQRDQIILKSKAATAGWDAAASADEKLEIEVQKAYQRGLKEEREKHKEDLASVNVSLETKETRITELLVQVGDMEKRMLESERLKKEMQAQVDSLKLEVADAIAGIQQIAAANVRGGGGAGSMPTEGDDGEIVIPPSAAELEQAREQLDVAQEELVSLMERCDRLEAELEIARRKNRIFERLANLTGLTSGKAASVGGSGMGGKGGASNDLSKYDFSDVITNVKKAITKGTNLWKSNRKDECYDVYLDVCIEATQRLMTEQLVKPVRDAIENGKVLGAQNKQRGAVTFRKALDKLLNDYNDGSIRGNEESAVANARAKQSASVEEQNQNNNELVKELMEQLDNMENSFLEQGYTKEKNPSNSNSAGDVQSSPRGEHQSGASLLQRAKSAENQVQSLRKQLAAVIAATAQAPVPAAGGRPTTAAVRQGAVAKTVVSQGVDAAEVRKLNRKIKELETQLKNNASSGGGPNAGAEIKAMQLAEKQLQKKLKDQETLLKRESKTIEMRAVKAENQLQKIQSTYNTIVSERDQLKTENSKLFQMTSEIGSLKAKAERCDELDTLIAQKDQELAMLQEQFKKESQLRKKYKNDLEDLKGAIRVYARCRPMARYEIEKGCKAVVQIKDETSLKLVTSRGEKEFEFDAVFSATSTQDQVFEDTKRLVESCLDGFNVCVFAYGQTGSGKTFTMTGSPSNPGLTPKAISELYRLMDERVHLQIKVTTYFVELYNDNLVDLYWVLDNQKAAANNVDPPKLEIKMDAKKMVFIRNAVIKDANSPEELFELFNRGNEQRHTGATKMNAESSRSHSIFAIMVESYDSTSKRTTTGKLSLVDLAGNELILTLFLRLILVIFRL